jgi:hypothetical protein
MEGETELVGVVGGELVVQWNTLQRRRRGRDEDKKFGVDALE